MSEIVKKSKTAPKVFVIRGPPGAGKSTVSNELAENLRSKGRKVAYLEQDYFRKVIFGSPGFENILACKVLLDTVKSIISNDCDVIVEGMLTTPKSNELLTSINDMYQDDCVISYLNVDIEETLLRHSGRDKASHITSEQIKKWSLLCEPCHCSREILLDNKDKNDTITQLLASVGLE